jgi:uncharacterized membrane protein YcaP (DUF421 family)
MQTTLLDVMLRTAAIYAVLYVSLRVLGKREVSQFTPFDLILLLTLANAVQNAMVGDNSSLGAGIAAALTLLALNFLLNLALARQPRLRHWLEGTPTMLVRHGKVEWLAMKHERLDREVLTTAIREHGLQGLHEVDLAVLELDGSISIIGSHENSMKNPSQKPRRRRARFSRLR